MTPVKLRRRGSEYVLTHPPPKMSHSFIQNCCWITSASFTSSRMKDLCQKWEVKLIFRGAYRAVSSVILVNNNYNYN